MSTTEGETRQGINAVDQAAAAQAAEAETSARAQGWVPKEDFRGDQTKWVGAGEFLEIQERRGVTTTRLRTDLDSVKQQNATLQAQLRAQQAALDALQETVVETKTTDLTATESDLTAQIKAARTANDFDKEEELRDKREEVRRQKARLTVDKSGGTAQAGGEVKDPTKSPEFQEFLKDNPWFETDRVMAAAAVATLAQLNAEGKTKDLTPTQRFALAAEETKKRFGIIGAKAGAQKMEGSRGGGDAGGGDGTDKAYADLPAEAKAACDRQSQRVVGPGKKFKDLASWQKSYTRTYFQ